MKPKVLLIVMVAILMGGQVLAQVTLTLRPDSITGKDAMVFSCEELGYNTRNFGSYPDLDAIAWSNTGFESNTRGLIEFNLGTIPANSTIISAHLSLFYNPTSINIGHASWDGPNTCLLQRVTEPWDEMTVTWETQPATTDSNEVVIPESDTVNQDYPNIEVTLLVRDMLRSTGQNHGFMLRLFDEMLYRSMIFASSDYADSTLHPVLQVVYNPPLGADDKSNPESMVICPNPNDGRFTIKSTGRTIQSMRITNEFGTTIKQSNVPFNSKDMDLTGIPAGIYVVTLETEDSVLSEKIIIK